MDAKDAATATVTKIFMSPEYGPAASLSKKMSRDGQGRYEAGKLMRRAPLLVIERLEDPDIPGDLPGIKQEVVSGDCDVERWVVNIHQR